MRRRSPSGEEGAAEARGKPRPRPYSGPRRACRPSLMGARKFDGGSHGLGRVADPQSRVPGRYRKVEARRALANAASVINTEKSNPTVVMGIRAYTLSGRYQSKNGGRNEAIQEEDANPESGHGRSGSFSFLWRRSGNGRRLGCGKGPGAMRQRHYLWHGGGWRLRSLVPGDVPALWLDELQTHRQ